MYTQASNTYLRQKINNNNCFAHFVGNKRIGMVRCTSYNSCNPRNNEARWAVRQAALYL